MRNATIVLAAGCLLSFGLLTSSFGQPSTEAYEVMLAKARSGDATAAYGLAERYAHPDQFPAWKGMTPDVMEAAIWCALIKDAAPTAYPTYSGKCADLTKGMSEADLGMANSIAMYKLNHGAAHAHG
jgi:hypothetical protein